MKAVSKLFTILTASAGSCFFPEAPLASKAAAALDFCQPTPA
jgi:hypothetical protein